MSTGEKTKWFGGVMTGSLCTTFLLAVGFFVLDHYEGKARREAAYREKREILQAIAEHPRLPIEYKSSIMKMLKTKYGATYEGDDFYRKLTSVLLNVHLFGGPGEEVSSRIPEGFYRPETGNDRIRIRELIKSRESVVDFELATDSPDRIIMTFRCGLYEAKDAPGKFALVPHLLLYSHNYQIFSDEQRMAAFEFTWENGAIIVTDRKTKTSRPFRKTVRER